MGRIPQSFLQDPNYNQDRFPRAFEDALLMVLKPNHLYAERINLANPYDVDFAIKQTIDNESIFYAEAEYDASGKIFTQKGEIYYEKLNILARKSKYFTKDKPTVFIKGNLKYVFVLDTKYVLEFGILTTIPCRFHKYNKPIHTFKDFCENTTVLEDKILQINTKHATEKGALRFGFLQNWLEYVKEIHNLGGLRI